MEAKKRAKLPIIALVLSNIGVVPLFGDNVSATGDYRLPEGARVVSNRPGYNSWPMIQAMGDKLVCSYSRDSVMRKDGHTIEDGSRDSYIRFSKDKGQTWSEERVVASDLTCGEVNEGIGLDSTGATLLWVRCWGKSCRHELYRTTDGIKTEKIATVTPKPMPMQITDIVKVKDLGLVSPWFAGQYRDDGCNSWGIMVSVDDGRSWSQRTIESGLSLKEWVTEPTLADLGDGRLLIIGRCEKNLGNLFQVTSVDGGETWCKRRTNISDVLESTPSLLYDKQTGNLTLYYYHRGARRLKRRIASVKCVFENPTNWPKAEVLARGYEVREYDAGNVNVTRMGDEDYCAWYTGTSSNAAVVVTVTDVRAAAKSVEN